MKKLSVILALVLCLVLSVFCFASCKKDAKNGDATTAKATAAPSTTAAPADTTAEIKTQAPHVHGPGDYEVDFPPSSTPSRRASIPPSLPSRTSHATASSWTR